MRVARRPLWSSAARLAARSPRHRLPALLESRNSDNVDAVSTAGARQLLETHDLLDLQPHVLHLRLRHLLADGLGLGRCPPLRARPREQMEVGGAELLPRRDQPRQPAAAGRGDEIKAEVGLLAAGAHPARGVGVVRAVVEERGAGVRQRVEQVEAQSVAARPQRVGALARTRALGEARRDRHGRHKLQHHAARRDGLGGVARVRLLCGPIEPERHLHPNLHPRLARRLEARRAGELRRGRRVRRVGVARARCARACAARHQPQTGRRFAVALCRHLGRREASRRVLAPRAALRQPHARDLEPAHDSPPCRLSGPAAASVLVVVTSVPQQQQRVGQRVSREVSGAEQVESPPPSVWRNGERQA
eukprot:scaffold58302_cov72-Phaeocystis_antarctica.AAC.3